ncbi:hypothetical protein QBC34DRAFT_161992 [Podospora aff. communis PSN243]|uniref:Uncharacterized protein n=1 Tax=Podospora aff. communis PSN243 TaxID=3040156 RepID=A0AAV9GB34_9PEZI|nr:hypothetical protein QBC34DRAFT_161992 [Podospora aff. communis PSN243]
MRARNIAHCSRFCSRCSRSAAPQTAGFREVTAKLVGGGQTGQMRKLLAALHLCAARRAMMRCWAMSAENATPLDRLPLRSAIFYRNFTTHTNPTIAQPRGLAGSCSRQIDPAVVIITPPTTCFASRGRRRGKRTTLPPCAALPVFPPKLAAGGVPLFRLKQWETKKRQAIAKLQEGEQGAAEPRSQEFDDLPLHPQTGVVESEWRVVVLAFVQAKGMTPWSTIATRHWLLSRPLRGWYVCQRPTCLAGQDGAAGSRDRVLGSLGSPRHRQSVVGRRPY